MIFSRNWLADYVDLPDDVQELTRRLTFAGHAVEGVEEKGGDVLLDIDVTTNRPDCMNHLGLAREIAVLLDRPLRLPESSPREGNEADEAVDGAASGEIEEEILCAPARPAGGRARRARGTRRTRRWTAPPRWRSKKRSSARASWRGWCVASRWERARPGSAPPWLRSGRARAAQWGLHPRPR